MTDAQEIWKKKTGTSYWYQMHLKVKLLVSRINSADKDSAKIDAIAAVLLLQVITDDEISWTVK